MKTLEEALPILAIPIAEGDAAMPLELVNQTDVARSVMECPDALDYIMFMVQMFKNRPDDQPGDICASIAMTAFIAGIRVGQEMEKL